MKLYESYDLIIDNASDTRASVDTASVDTTTVFAEDAERHGSTGSSHPQRATITPDRKRPR